jgi:putative transposase
MSRLARLVVPGVPHHVTQRGNRREQVFFGDDDYRFYLDVLAENAARAKAQIWAYCVMPNHIHVILTPSDEDGIRATFADLHRRYTKRINVRGGFTGHLWQGRFGSVAMDEDHLLTAVRYVALSPVRAGLAARPQDWAWSSARAHLAGQDDGVVAVGPVLERVANFAEFIAEPVDEAVFAPLRLSETTGRPLGGADWVKGLEASSGRSLAPKKRGRKPATVGGS